MNFFQKKNDYQQKQEGLSFSRFEIKYILNKKISFDIQNKIKNFMDLDGFAKLVPSQQYFVRSLYFDNDYFHNFREKTDGIKLRHKFRIRTYSSERDKSSIIYLEKKGRFNERTYKIRKKIELDDLDEILNNKSNKIKLLKKFENDFLVNDFVFDYFKKLIKPKVIVDYYRKPFVNKIGNYFRLTFDKNINSILSNNLFNSSNQQKKTIAGYEILEVKFDRTIPPWFQKLIQSYQLKRVSVSKYVLGCEATKLAYDYEGR
jgi:hypothetical protein